MCIRALHIRRLRRKPKFLTSLFEAQVDEPEATS